jgi:hypothetical protein
MPLALTDDEMKADLEPATGAGSRSQIGPGKWPAPVLRMGAGMGQALTRPLALTSVRSRRTYLA